jgi:nucleoid-associated protein EbfC
MSSDTPENDPFALLASAQEALAAQAEAAQQTVEGTAGGGVVKVQMTGGGEITDITLAREVVDPEDIDMLQDLILAAVRDAASKAAELQREALGPLGQIDLGSLGGLFGPGGAVGPGQ